MAFVLAIRVQVMGSISIRSFSLFQKPDSLGGCGLELAALSLASQGACLICLTLVIQDGRLDLKPNPLQMPGGTESRGNQNPRHAYWTERR